MVIVDASPLIVLAKIRRLEVLRDLYKQVGIGPAVKREVLDQGKAIAARGVELVEKALEDGSIQPVQLNSEERKLAHHIIHTSRMAEGEAESLALAHSRKAMIVLDDREARDYAAAKGEKFTGTAGLLLEAFLIGHLNIGQLEDAVSDLSRMLWLSPAIVTEILKRAREAAK